MFKNIFQRIIYFIIQPTQSWETATEEDQEVDKLLSGYLYPIFGTITLAAFIGSFWAGQSIEVALKASIREFSAAFAGFYLASFLLKEIMERYFEKSTLKRCQFFVAYSSSLIYLVSIAGSLTNGFGLFYLCLPYTVYIVWEGASSFMAVKEEQQLKFTTLATIVLASPFLISFVINKFMLITPIHAAG